MSFTTEEVMAIEILKGNKYAAKALADKLQEEYADGATLLPPVQKITVPIDQLRVVVYMRHSDADVVVDPAFRVQIEEWIREGGVLMCSNVDRLEIYQMPTWLEAEGIV